MRSDASSRKNSGELFFRGLYHILAGIARCKCIFLRIIHFLREFLGRMHKEMASARNALISNSGFSHERILYRSQAHYVSAMKKMAASSAALPDSEVPHLPTWR